MAFRVALGIALAVVILGAAEIAQGWLSFEKASVLVGFTLFLLGFIALAVWMLGRQREQASLFRKAVNAVVLAGGASLVAYATVQLAPPWLAETLRKNPSRPFMPPSRASVPNLTEIPSHLDGSELQGLKPPAQRSDGRP